MESTILWEVGCLFSIIYLPFLAIPPERNSKGATLCTSTNNQMSKNRPVSVEEIIRNSQTETQILAKPKFLSKHERRRLAALKQEREHEEKAKKQANPVKRLYDEVSVPHNNNGASNAKNEEVSSSNSKRINEEISSSSKRIKGGHKFNFDWDAQEDTSGDFKPLVEFAAGARGTPKHELGLSDKHWSDKNVDEMTARDWRIFRDDYSITVRGGGDIANPLRSWQESRITSRLIDIITNKLGYTDPTAIQRAAIPLALQPRDLVGIAETGSGKTLAFLIPLLNYLLSIDSNYLQYEHANEINSNKPLGLILAPTRELANQISREAQKFCDILHLTVVTIIGGHQYEETVHSVRNGVHIVVATPGRLIDSLERGIVSLDKCYYFTMDEADRMIDMGFEKSLQSILTYLPSSSSLLDNPRDARILKIKQRTTLMFTATITPAIEKITNNYLIDPIHLTIGNPNNVLDNIEQKFEYLGAASTEETSKNPEVLNPKKLDKLIREVKAHIHHNRNYSMIIFANYKRTCESLALELSNNGINDNIVIHGSKSQEMREAAIENFRSHRVNVLIATDVAARGLDVPNVSLVVNYQMPNKFEEYIHRIGRTGRAGNFGTSYTLIDNGDAESFLPLKKFLSRGRQKCPDWLLKNVAQANQILRD